MAVIKLDAKPLNIGKKSISVKPTGAVVIKTLKLQQALGEYEQKVDNSDDYMETADATLAVLKKVEDYLEGVLGLSEEAYEKFTESVEFETIFQYVSYVVASLQYGNATTFAEFTKASKPEEEQDPKSEEGD